MHHEVRGARLRFRWEYAGVVELVDAPDSKSGSVRSVGSIPTARTTFWIVLAKVGIEFERLPLPDTDLPSAR